MGAGIGDGNSKLFTALATAAVLEEALKGIAYTKIVAFDGGTNTVEHCVIKDFDQKEIGCRCIDAMTQIAAGNGNKDGYSIRAAALDLAKRTERRRILMVLSDGLPSGYFSESEAIDDVRTAAGGAPPGVARHSDHLHRAHGRERGCLPPHVRKEHDLCRFRRHARRVRASAHEAGALSGGRVCKCLTSPVRCAMMLSR